MAAVESLGGQMRRVRGWEASGPDHATSRSAGAGDGGDDGASWPGGG